MTKKVNQKAQNLVDFPQYQDTLAETQTGCVFIQYNLDVTPDSQWFIAHTNPKARAHLPYVQEVGEFVTGKNYMTTRQGLQSYLLKITLDGISELRRKALHAFSRTVFLDRLSETELLCNRFRHGTLECDLDAFLGKFHTRLLRKLYGTQ